MEESWQSTLQDFGRNLIDVPFVVIDLETTGGAAHLGATITEIGAVKVKGGKVLSEFKSFVDPQLPIPGYITELTGITDQMVFQAPTIKEIFPTLLEFIGPPHESVVVAHHAPFDLSFLKFLAAASDFTWPPFPVVDTAVIARRTFSRDEVPNCKLSTLAEIFESPITPNHRALDDAKATVHVLHAILERLGSLDIYTLEELLNFAVKKR